MVLTFQQLFLDINLDELDKVVLNFFLIYDQSYNNIFEEN